MNSYTCHLLLTDSWQLHFPPLSLSFCSSFNLQICSVYLPLTPPTVPYLLLVLHHHFILLPLSLSLSFCLSASLPVYLLNILNQPQWNCWAAAQTPGENISIWHETKAHISVLLSVHMNYDALINTHAAEVRIKIKSLLKIHISNWFSLWLFLLMWWPNLWIQHSEVDTVSLES